tara:strand:+ start:593 stop:934 length:342 start_codon:yes stop_codon:yes gene_type:complete
MKKTEKAYIKIELGTAVWNVDLETNAEQDILEDGISCSTEDVYELIYEGYTCSEEHLKMLLDEPNNSKNMFYPLDCQKDLSYNDWKNYKDKADSWKAEIRRNERTHWEGGWSE